MIRIRRGAAPAVLTGRGAAARAALEAAYDAAPDDYRSGVRRFEFDGALYGHRTVKAALAAMQHGKCAFCETKIAPGFYGDVEHFRPKAGARQRVSDPLERPGYYWLAYEWSNLFLSCALCNQRHKRNLFPLRAPKHRARSFRDDHTAEHPLFVDPCVDDPADHISFRAEVPYPKRRSVRGRWKIEALGLAREALNEDRREKLALVRGLIDVVLLSRRSPDPELRTQAARALAAIRHAARDASPYAAMVRALLARHRMRPED